jgi:uncharacterized membrane protein
VSLEDVFNQFFHPHLLPWQTGAIVVLVLVDLPLNRGANIQFSLFMAEVFSKLEYYVRTVGRDAAIMNILHMITVLLWIFCLKLARWTTKWKIPMVLMTLYQKQVHWILPLAALLLLLIYSIDWLISLGYSPAPKLASPI